MAQTPGNNKTKTSKKDYSLVPVPKTSEEIDIMEDKAGFLGPTIARSDDKHFEIGIEETDAPLDPKRRWFQTDKEKCWFVAFLVSFVVAFSVIVVLIVESHLQGSDVCTDDGCVLLAGSILQYLNTSADPCEDFYEYACGSWELEHPRPDDKARWSSFSVLTEKNQYDVLEVVEAHKGTLNMKDGEQPTDAVTKATLFYVTCSDLEEIENQGLDVIQDLISSDVVWEPTSDVTSWSDEDIESLTRAIVKIHLDGETSVFNVWVGADDRISTVNIVQFSQSGLGLPSKEYYDRPDDDAAIQAYVKYISTLFQLTYNNTDSITANLTAWEIYNFEKKLADLFVAKDELRDPQASYNKMTAADFQTNYPFIDWDIYFRLIFPERDLSSLSDFELLLQTPSYFEGLAELLPKTSQETVMDYMRFHRISSYSHHLGKLYRDAAFEKNKVISGVQSEPARWKICLDRTDDLLGFALGKLFVDRKFSGKSRDTAEEMIKGIKDAFKKGLSNLDWMTPATAEKAKSKADHVMQKIGYPDFIRKKDELDEYYEELSIGSDYLQNIYGSRLWDMKRNLDDLDKPVDKMRWDMSPATVNAYYSPSNNEIVFPAGIMQPPFFSSNFLQAVNYGGMGVVMGHELTHGFDDQGSQFDEDGNLVPWWEKSVTEKFNERTGCLADFYGKFKVDSGKSINGNLTLGENIADNGGLKEAYKAYQEWVKQYGTEKRLPSDALKHLTPNKLFFLGFSQVWCSIATEEYEELSLDTDPHSPPKFRVIGTLSNSDDFAKAWECPKGSPMNPNDKCVVW